MDKFLQQRKAVSRRCRAPEQDAHALHDGQRRRDVCPLRRGRGALRRCTCARARARPAVGRSAVGHRMLLLLLLQDVLQRGRERRHERCETRALRAVSMRHNQRQRLHHLRNELFFAPLEQCSIVSLLSIRVGTCPYLLLLVSGEQTNLLLAYTLP